MDEKLLEELDFRRITKEASEYCMGEESAENLAQRLPFKSREDALPYKKAASQWLKVLSLSEKTPLSPWPLVHDLFPVLRTEGAALSIEEIFALGLFTSSCEAVRKTVTDAALEEDVSVLLQKVSLIPSLEKARTEIFNIITADGKIRPLPQITALQNKILELRTDIENSLRKYTADVSLKDAMQSSVPALKANRELLAVKASAKNRIEGIVHEVSASGQTVYIEPEETVRKNNELLSCEAELNAELHKIFRELTEKLSFYADDFESALKEMIFLDTTLASAKQALKTGGIFAEDTAPCEAPVILGARHPVLGEAAVPVDIKFMEGKNILIITGPNTGGKTVTLKTTALFVLLNQAGLSIRAEEGTKLPFFTSVFADIGDEQSIEGNLSTFSSRMKKMAAILEKADDKSLVLLDELGSGTDPAEGSAISMACLDTLIERKSFVLVTTHLGVLKNYGWTNPYCINASVEFSREENRPTYRLVMGVPGESHALTIAETAGIPPLVMEKARSYMSTEQADVSFLIKGLNQKHSELDELIREEAQKNADLLSKTHKLHEREIRLSEKQLELSEKERNLSSLFLKETRSRLENLVRELREGEITREKTLGVKSFILSAEEELKEQDKLLEESKAALEKEKEELLREEEIISENGIRLSKLRGNSRQSAKKTKGKLSNKEALKKASPLNLPVQETNAGKKTVQKKISFFEPGKEVLAGKNRLSGRLIEQTKKGVWLVQLGSVKMSFDEKQLVLKDKPENDAKNVSYVYEKAGSTFTSDERPVYELKLLGMRFTEAMRALEKQLDLCSITGFKDFSVIHGKGNGVLQQGVHDYLSNHPGVKNFSFAPPEQGGTGKTYVTLY
ncbi:MAG: Smr/MutS family protein [Treponema sp.]|nr:Smr/MutS family protein [Treponema sp.]